jgi:hypothetical protein
MRPPTSRHVYENRECRKNELDLASES